MSRTWYVKFWRNLTYHVGFLEKIQEMLRIVDDKGTELITVLYQNMKSTSSANVVRGVKFSSS